MASPALMAYKACICKKSFSPDSIFFSYATRQPAAIFLYLDFELSFGPEFVAIATVCLGRLVILLLFGNYCLISQSSKQRKNAADIHLEFKYICLT